MSRPRKHDNPVRIEGQVDGPTRIILQDHLTIGANGCLDLKHARVRQHTSNGTYHITVQNLGCLPGVDGVCTLCGEATHRQADATGLVATPAHS